MIRAVIIDVVDYDQIQKQFFIVTEELNKLGRMLESVSIVAIPNSKDRDEMPQTGTVEMTDKPYR